MWNTAVLQKSYISILRPAARISIPAFVSMTSSVAGQNRAAWLVEAKGAIEVGPAEIVKPEKGEVLIRARLQSSFSSIVRREMLTLQCPC